MTSSHPQLICLSCITWHWKKLLETVTLARATCTYVWTQNAEGGGWGGGRLHTKNTYNFYLVIEVLGHVYVFYAYRLYFADKDIYMIRYFNHKTEIIFFSPCHHLPLSISIPLNQWECIFPWNSRVQMLLCAMLHSSIAHSNICTRLFRGKMHSDWFNGIEILKGRWWHGEKVGYCYPSGL